MQNEIRILNWNVGGAKYLEAGGNSVAEASAKREAFREELNQRLQELIENYDPHVITLQEVVDYNRPGEPRTSIIKDLDDYTSAPTMLIDNVRYPYVRKWRKAEEGGKWPKGSYFGQGSAILWKRMEGFSHFPVWYLPGRDRMWDGGIHIEEVIVMSGLYFGDRNTEPRAAMVAHFMMMDGDVEKGTAKPLDIFVVNLHLTTLKNEREGVPEVDQAAANIRSSQLDIVLDGIVSRYNIWRSNDYLLPGDKHTKADAQESNTPGEGDDWKKESRHPPIWILSGDFNFTPESAEYERVKRANFVDVCLDRGLGTKGSGFGSQPTITCDYIFVGSKYVSFDPVLLEHAVKNNPKPEARIKVSDHFPMFARIPITRRQ